MRPVEKRKMVETYPALDKKNGILLLDYIAK
jgi:hypothetical protein